MGILVMGLSHKTAPIEIREHLTVPESRLAEALAELRASGALSEAVILSTCNRLEIYAKPDDMQKATAALKSFFLKLYDSPKLAPALYTREASDAVHHLFRVASGLESLVIGETDVLGQVKSAYLFAQKQGSTGKITNVLFQRALFVGKAVRTHTNISEGSSSVGSIAVQLAERIFGNLKERKVLVIGAGKMAEVTARHLLSQKAHELMILNRTPEKAKEIAEQLNGSWGTLDRLESELASADIVVCSTSSDKPLITRDLIEPLMKARRMRSLYFIDIAVPRNVEPEVHTLDNVYVYNIDDLKSLVDENMGQRQAEVGEASELVKGMANEFSEWLSAALEGRDRPLRHTFQAEA